MSSSIRDLLIWLEEAKEVEGSDQIIFDKDEVQPVIFQPLGDGGDGGDGGGGGQGPEFEDDVEGEIWTSPQEGESGEGEQSDSPFDIKQIGDEKSSEKEGEEKGKGKEGEAGEGEAGEGEAGEGEAGEGEAGEGEAKGKPKGGKETEKAGEEGEVTYEMDGKKLGNTTDSHDIFDKMSDSETVKEKMERSSKNIAKEIQSQAEKKRKEIKRRGGSAQKGAGGGPDDSGSFFEEVLNKVFKPKIDWTLLAGAINNHFISIRKNMAAMAKSRVFQQEMSKLKKTERSSRIKKPSYAKSITEPKTQLDRDLSGGGQKVLEPGQQKYLPETEVNLIVALDTSGSVSQKFLDIALSELSNISTQLEKNLRGSKGQKLRGKTWLMTWSSSPGDIAVEEFSKGDFERYAKGEKKVKTAHSGTVPETVFDYINNHIIEMNDNLGKINLKEIPEKDKIKKDDTYLPLNNGEPTAMPFLLFVTDAGFWHPVEANSLGNYNNNANTLKSVWYLVLDASENDKKMCYPKNIIEYNIVKV